MSAANLVAFGLVLMLLLMLALAARPRGPSTLDFYLAGQRIGVITNACAICGDYFSAASFLGVAAAVYTSGLDGLWYAAGFAAGFMPVLLFVAAPLRRFGQFSLPDFLGRRLESEAVRMCAVVVVGLVVLAYLVPQAVGSGITWQILVGRGLAGVPPYETGVLVSTAVIAGVVALGGMRGATWTQAIQFLFLLAALIWLAVAVLGSGFDYPRAVEQLGTVPLENPVRTEEGWRLEPAPNRLRPGELAQFSEPGARYGSLGQFALIVTLIMGTAGLPHVMNRYFTSPSGTAARTTTVWVLGLAGLFYSLAVFLGTAARALIPDLAAVHPWLERITVEGVLQVPEHALLALGRAYGGVAGLSLVATGALVAVMSTIAGLLLAGAASWGHDFYERYVNPRATQVEAVRAGQAAVVVAAGLSAALALVLHPEGLLNVFPSLVATMVTWAFALAGSALTPVIILSIWWPRTTAAGAVGGMVAGSLTALGLFGIGVGMAGSGHLVSALLTPTIVAAPIALAAAVIVSLRTSPPPDIDRIWLRLHGTAADRQALRLAALTIRPEGHPRRLSLSSGLWRRGEGG